jgi:hypothetical protein
VSVFVPVISGLVAALVVYVLSRFVRREPNRRGSRHWVEYGAAYKLLSAAFFPLSAFVTYAALQASPDQKTIAGLIAIGFWIGTMYLAYEFFFVNLSYDDDFIYHQTPLRGQREIPWNSLNDVRYSPTMQSFTLVTDGYGNISVSPFANGSQALIERVSKQIEIHHPS